VTSSLVESDGQGGHTVYAYDASGQRVLQARVADANGPGTATAYVASGQVDDPDTASASTGDLTATRYYTFGGSTVAVRTNDNKLSLMLGDEQGSTNVMMPVTVQTDGTLAKATLADAAASTRTSYTPYGELRGTVDNLATDRGWLGQVEDRVVGTGASSTGTGLTYLNARYYDPATSRFISPDPLMNPGDPKTLDPYRYADNNPVVFTDATGLQALGQFDCGLGKACASSSASAIVASQPSRPAFRASPRSVGRLILHGVWGIVLSASPIAQAPRVVSEAKAAFANPSANFHAGVSSYGQSGSDMGTAYKSGWNWLNGKGSRQQWWTDATHQPGALYVGNSWDAGDYNGVATKAGIAIGITAQIAVPIVGGANAMKGVATAADAVPSAGWSLADSIENLTKAGNSPAWSTVRARYWKNAANDALDGEYSAGNLERMATGKPPLHDEIGVRMELNHITPRWQGGGHSLDNLEPLWPWEHSDVDPYRHYTGPRP
jgi:RHS repeat-associated protein